MKPIPKRTAITPMNLLPIVINAPGMYITRCGKRVQIDTVKDHSDDYTVTRFNCTGNVLTLHPSGRTTRKYAIWHECGLYQGHGINDLDIMGKAESD